MQAGSLQLLTPVELRDIRVEAKRKLQEGMTEMWEMLSQVCNLGTHEMRYLALPSHPNACRIATACGTQAE